MSYTHHIAARQPRSDTAPTGAADNVRGLLTTVLGEFVLPAGGSVWTQTLVRTLGLLDVKEKAARQAIARMHENGWLDRERVGRRTRWSLTSESQQLLVDGAARIYGFGQTPAAWDGNWVVVVASVPESDRAIRYRMVTGLRWAGFGSLGQGVWVSPWAERDEEATELLRTLGVDATSFVGPLGALGSAPAVADQAWDLDSLRAAYDEFLDRTPAPPPTAESGEEAARQLIDAVHRWRRFPGLDPRLPYALLPADWPGPAAAGRFAEVRGAVLDPALRWWQMVESDAEATEESHAR